MSNQTVRCTKCGHTAPYSEWPKGRDFFQNPYVSKCVNPDCDNRQSPGDASMRMMPGQESPFVFVRNAAPTEPLAATLHKANEAKALAVSLDKWMKWAQGLPVTDKQWRRFNQDWTEAQAALAPFEDAP